MEVEDLPTKRQSGSFGIMTDACRATEEELVSLLADDGFAHARSSIETLLARLADVTREIAVWPSAPPEDDVKSRQIDRVLAIQSDLQSIVQRANT